MKKKLLLAGAAVLLAAAAVTGYSAYNQTNASLLMANVNALADPEGTTGGESSGCPNGCKDGGIGCYCYFWYPTYREAIW